MTIQRGVMYKLKLDNNGDRLAFNRMDPSNFLFWCCFLFSWNNYNFYFERANFGAQILDISPPAENKATSTFCSNRSDKEIISYSFPK